VADEPQHPPEGQEPSLADALRASRGTEPQSPPPGQEPDSNAGQAPAATPPWGTGFDAEKAWALVQNLRTDNATLKQRERDRERSEMSELERLKSEREQFRQERDHARTEVLRSTVAAAKGLPANAITFLTGTTQEELERNADALKAMIGTGNGITPPPPDFGAGARPNGGPTSEEDNFSAVLRRAAGRP
jgi:hypothetical protein